METICIATLLTVVCQLQQPNPRIIHVAPAYTQEDQARVREWEIRCKPVIYEDKEGIRRYRYAAPNCGG